MAESVNPERSVRSHLQLNRDNRGASSILARGRCWFRSVLLHALHVCDDIGCTTTVPGLYVTRTAQHGRIIRF